MHFFLEMKMKEIFWTADCSEVIFCSTDCSEEEEGWGMSSEAVPAPETGADSGGGVSSCLL